MACTELSDAIRLAHKVLNERGRDPDDDISMLARQFLRADEVRNPCPFCDWREDRGDVLWWRIPISEAPYVGSPLDLGDTWSLHVYDGAGREVGSREDHRITVGAWPFDESDERHLWWTPLPDAKRIEDQVPL